ncbi:MAG: hypothetical protein JNM26_10705 [Ideonella sp.]|nr:hypothetical protein [Ideonella sp.]
MTRRRVYYLAGFDTRSPRFYHQLYRTQAERQQAINGCRYAVGELQPVDEHSARFEVHADGPGGPVHTTYTCLQWNDIVRAHWPASTLRVAAGIPAFYRHYGRTGCLRRTRELSRPFYLIMMLPLWYVLVGAVLALLAAVAASGLAQRAGAGGGLSLAAAAAGFVATMAFTLFACERQRVFWLMRAWTYMIDWARRPEQTHARWARFARQIDAELAAEPADEVLIVGHSAGAIAAISVAERWLARAAETGPRPAHVKLMTVGNITPVLGVIPEAGWFRAQIVAVGASSMTWMEYTAPTDPLCYALVNPFRACGLPPLTRPGFRIKSARFDKMFEPATNRRMRRDLFQNHFQYLVATDRPVDNDYFTLTAGPRPLPIGVPVA